MRSSKLLFLAGCFTVIAMVMIGFGCSDDTPTTPIVDPPVVEEEEEDNGIETLLEGVSPYANAIVDSILAVVGSGLEVATFLDAGTDVNGDLFLGGTLPDGIKDEDNWIISWTTDLQAGLGTSSSTDSLTYVVAGELSTEAKDATSMHVKHHYSFVSSDSTVSSTDVVNVGYFDFHGISGNLALVTGTFSSVINDKEVTSESTTWNDWTIEAQVGVGVTKSGSSWTNGCPEGGAVALTIEHRYAEDLEVPVTTVWEMMVTFTNGNAEVDVVTGQLSTSYENAFCTP